MWSYGIWIAAGYGANWECEGSVCETVDVFQLSAREDDFKEFFHRENKG